MIVAEMDQIEARQSTVGERIRRFRLDRGWSQSDLSMRAGVPQTTIHKIESGLTASPRVDTLQLLAEALEVSLRDLTSEPELVHIGGDEWETQQIRQYAPNTPVGEARELLEDYDHLDASGRRAVKALIDGLRRSSVDKDKVREG